MHFRGGNWRTGKIAYNRAIHWATFDKHQRSIHECELSAFQNDPVRPDFPAILPARGRFRRGDLRLWPAEHEYSARDRLRAALLFPAGPALLPARATEVGWTGPGRPGGPGARGRGDRRAEWEAAGQR